MEEAKKKTEKAKKKLDQWHKRVAVAQKKFED